MSFARAASQMQRTETKGRGFPFLTPLSHYCRRANDAARRKVPGPDESGDAGDLQFFRDHR